MESPRTNDPTGAGSLAGTDGLGEGVAGAVGLADGVAGVVAPEGGAAEGVGSTLGDAGGTIGGRHGGRCGDGVAVASGDGGATAVTSPRGVVAPAATVAHPVREITAATRMTVARMHPWSLMT